MKIEFKNDVLALEQDMNAFAYSAACPEGLRQKIAAIPAAERVNRGAQVLYAHYDLLDAAGKRACAQMFCYAANMGWAKFNEDHKSTDIVSRIELDLDGGDTGEDADWPVPQRGMRAGRADWRLAATEEEPSE